MCSSNPSNKSVVLLEHTNQSMLCIWNNNENSVTIKRTREETSCFFSSSQLILATKKEKKGNKLHAIQRTKRNRLTLSAALLIWWGPVWRTYSRTKVQTESNSDTTSRRSTNLTDSTTIACRKAGTSSNQGSCKAPFNRNKRKSTMDVVSKGLNTSWWRWRKHRKNTSEENSRQKANCRPSSRLSLRTRSRVGLPPRILRGKREPGMTLTNRDRAASSTSGTRCPAGSACTHTSNRVCFSHVLTTQICSSSTSSKVTLNSPKVTMRALRARRIRGNKAWQTSDYNKTTKPAVKSTTQNHRTRRTIKMVTKSNNRNPRTNDSQRLHITLYRGSSDLRVARKQPQRRRRNM